MAWPFGISLILVSCNGIRIVTDLLMPHAPLGSTVSFHPVSTDAL